MDSVLQAGEGKSCAQESLPLLPWEQLILPAHICCPSALRFVNVLRKMRFSFGAEPHLLRVAVVKYAFPEALSILDKQCWGLSCPLSCLCLECIRLFPSAPQVECFGSASGGVLSNFPSAVQAWNHITVTAPNWPDVTFPSLLDSCSYLQGLYLQSSGTLCLSPIEWNMHWQVLHTKQRTNMFGAEPVWAQSRAGLTRPCCTSSGQKVAPDAQFWKRTARF